MKIYVSHSAPDHAGEVEWFVVEAAPLSTVEDAVESLRAARRSVYELDVEPWNGKREGK
jgi:hypothetical protein